MRTVKNKIRTMILFFCCALLIVGCSNSKGDDINNLKKQKVIVNDNGSTIIFSQDSPGLNQIKTVTAQKGTALISVRIPARVVASISQALSGSEKVILFDSPETNSLYSSYRQSKANFERSTRNYSRVKDMYENQMATAKDLNDADNEIINNRTMMLEMEARFRSLGFNPVDLENSHPNTLWLIADVPESQLKEVQKGESVDIYFSSLPQKKLEGRAEAIGDVVDPVTRSVKVRISMSNYEKFLPGMYAIVDFGDPIYSVVTLPNSSIITVEGKDYAFVENSAGVFTRREVFIGQLDSSAIIILKGIETGERVVTDGAILLKGLSFGY